MFAPLIFNMFNGGKKIEEAADEPVKNTAKLGYQCPDEQTDHRCLICMRTCIISVQQMVLVQRYITNTN